MVQPELDLVIEIAAQNDRTRRIERHGDVGRPALGVNRPVIAAGNYATTAVYEVFATGRAEKRFDVQGWTFKMARVR